MQNKREIRQELKQLKASQLTEWQGQTARRQMSDQYWTKHIDEAIMLGSEAKIVPTSHRFSLASVIAIAASFIVLLAGTWMFFQYVDSNEMSLIAKELETIPSEEIEQYIAANLDDFDLALLSTYAEETEGDFFFEVDTKLDSIDENWTEGTDWLLPAEEGIDLF